MAVNSITQTISTIPEAGRRGVDVQTIFVNKQEAFQDALTDVFVGQINTLRTQLNTFVGQVNTTATQVDTNATTASTSATTATTKASEASTSASQALTSRNQAETFKNSASTSATTATTKASEASASATSASTSATTATTKASEASASATSASTSASQALTSRNQAETFAQQAQASASSVDANNIVHRTGNETIAGVKSFSSSPIVPTPTSDTQVANKAYADTKQSKSEISYNANTSSFIANTLSSGAIIEKGTNINGVYIKFADGTIIMTGIVSFDIPDTFSGTIGSRYKIVTWNYPHTIVDTPIITVGGGMNAQSGSEATIGNVAVFSQRYDGQGSSGTACPINAREIRAASSTTGVAVSVVAVSRWK